MGFGDNSLREIVADDLRYMAATFDRSMPSPHDIRRASTILRRLLLDANLQQARTEAGSRTKATLRAYPLTQVLELSSGLSHISLAMAGGFRLGNRQVGPFSLMNSGPQFQKAIPNPPVVDEVNVQRFLKSTCIITAGIEISRGDVLKYLANKLGGAHFDVKGKSGTNGSPAAELSQLDDFMMIEPMSCVHLAVLSIIQAVVSSVSVMEPFGLTPIDLDLSMPLNSGQDEINIPARAWLTFDLLGGAGPTSPE